MTDSPALTVSPVVRGATVADLAAVLICVTAAFEPYIVRIGKPPAPMLADYAALIAQGSVWVADVNAEVVGVLVQYETTDGFYMDTVAVSPSYQGRGIGRVMLQFAEDEALQRGYQSLYTCTNVKMTENQVLYPRRGYQECDRRIDQGYDRIFYRKYLTVEMIDQQGC